MNTNQNDIQNSIALALQKLFSSSQPSQEEGGNRRESFDNVTAKDRDPFKTGLLRFSTDQTKVDIFTYLTHFTTTVCSYLNEQDKKKALIERICMADRLKLQQINIDDFDFETLKSKIGQALSKPELGRQFEAFFQNMKMRGTITEHFRETESKWNGYAAWRACTQKTAPEEYFFLDKFEDSVPDYIRPNIIKARIDGIIDSIQTLGMYIETYKQMWQENTSTLAPKLLMAQLHTLQTQNDSLQAAIKLVVDEQKEARGLAESAKNLNQIVSDNSTKLTDKVNRQAIEVHERLKDLSKLTNTVQDSIEKEKFSVQRQFSQLQQQNRMSNLNNFSGSFIHKDRQRDEGDRFRGRDRNPRDQSPGRSSPRSGYSSGESRSPSPNPIDGKCFACGDEHWQVRCPHLTRIEKENELLKILAKKEKLRKNRNGEEELLRTEYGVPKNPQSQVDVNSSNRKNPPMGSGPYCKWCHARGHSTLVCASFCVLCECSGHGWRECTETAHKATIAQRLITFRTSLAKADKLSYKL